MTSEQFAVFVGFCVLLYFVFIAGRASAKREADKKIAAIPTMDRLDEADIRQYLRKLRPLTSHNSPTDASIFIWANGEISLDAKLLNGMRVQASADTLEQAVEKIRRQCVEVQDALK